MSPDPAKTYRVLFVEDAFDQALLVKAFLSSTGDYEVTHSQDGDHAVELLHSQEWDIVITDLNLPGTDGFEVIRRARAKSADLPVLATTGYTGSEFHEQAHRDGANDLLTKPLDKEEFLTHVAVLVGSSDPEVAASTAILAIGGLAGDVEIACGGTLMQVASRGQTAVVVPLWNDELDAKGLGLKASKQACDSMEGQLVIDKAALDDGHPARIEALRVAQSVTGPVERVPEYQTTTTGLDLKPTHFVKIGRQMALKNKALATFGVAVSGRMDRTPVMSEAYARYWGRYQQFMEVEAFEIIKGKI